MNLCALESQRLLRDLTRLESWSKGTVSWLGEEELAKADEPAVIVGTWLQDDPGGARELIRSRSHRRATTLIVPRLPNLDFAAHVDAPASIELERQSFDSVNFAGERAFAVPGQTTIDSPLSHGRWAVSEAGDPVVLAFRPNEDAGWVVFCTASLCGRGIGLDESAQAGLLEAILGKAALTQPKPREEKEEPYPVTLTCDDLGAVLGERPEWVPVFLSLLATEGKRDESALREAAKALGLQLGEDLELDLLPDCGPDALESALNERGWKAYVRRVHQMTKGNAIV